MVKLKVREKSLHYSKIKKKQTNQREKELEQTIAKLEDDLDNRYANDPQLSNLEEQLNKKKLELENIIEVLTTWAEVNFEDEITCESQFLDQSLWHNSLIRINNRPIFLSIMVPERCFTSETFERWLKLLPILN